MLSTSIKISISKESSVPVRDQLIEQIGLQIASGILQDKDKLPSIRALAQKLGIHHSTITAAYNHLEQAGLLEIRQGSGVRVASKALATAAGSSSLERLFRQFLTQAAEADYSREEVLNFFTERLKSSPVKRILVVDRNEDFHPILLAELEPYFDLPVEPTTFENLSKNTKLLKDSLIVTSFYHLLPLQSLNLDPTRFVLCSIEPGKEEMEAIAKVSSGSIIAIVSASSTLLKMAKNMAAAARGEDIAVRSVKLEEKTELSYLIKHADLVICDKPSESTVRSLSGKVPVKVFRLYSPSTLNIIKTRLKKWG